MPRSSSVFACLALSAFAAVPVSARASDAPATAAEARKQIDLAVLPLSPGGEKTNRRRLAELAYTTKSSVKSAYEFHRKQLLDAGWAEQPNAYVTDQSASNTFTKNGYAASLTVYPTGMDDKTSVILTQHGNVDLGVLPVPEGSKTLYKGPASAMFVVEPNPKAALEHVRAELAKQGWLPYGVAADTHFFKRNNVLLTANIAASPGQEGKTVVSYGAQLMSADLPAPPEFETLQYSDSTTALFVDTPIKEDELFKFYRETLAKAGWKATTDAPFKSGFRREMIFRNDAKDLIEIQAQDNKGKTRANVKFETAAEVAEAEKRFDEMQAARKKKAAEPKPKQGVTTPEGATDVKFGKSGLEFKVAAGTARDAIAPIRKELVKDGWVEKVQAAEEKAGVISYTRKDASLSLSYFDTGFFPAEIKLTGIGVELEPAK